MVRASAVLLAILFSPMMLTACADSEPAAPPTANQPAAPAAGTIVATSDLGTGAFSPIPVAVAKRITYISRSGINDTPTQVTAAVFQPGGRPPQRGWPIVVYGHPSVGTHHDCAPSLTPDLRGGAATISGLLRAGYVVAAPDYQGLGGPTDAKAYHPYLDSTSAGYNMVDAVRAVRNLIPDASIRWAALGVEQGGQAAWAANELAANEGWGLDLVGSASLSPIADVDALADAGGTLNHEQQLLLLGYLDAVHREYPDDFPLDDYRRGVAAQRWDALLACDDANSAERGRLVASLGPDDLGPADAAATARLRGFLRKTTLPQGSAKAPMLVVYRADDPLIPAAWTAHAIERACQLGDTISITVLPNGTRIAPEMALGWIADRFNGVAAQNDCRPAPAKAAS